MIFSTASTTTIASSTTMPIASTSPNSVSMLIEKPISSRPAMVPTSDTGMASIGMIVARMLPRNTYTTSSTSTNASMNVCSTSSIDALTKTVVS